MKLTGVRNVSRLLQHFFFSRNSLQHIKQFSNLAKILKPFKVTNLINYRSYIIYLFSYISKSLSTNDKAKILAYHYLFLKNNFNQSQLEKIFLADIVYFKECSDNDVYAVTLASSSMLEFEGSLSLHFILNRVKIYTLSFTIAPGEVFNCGEGPIIFVSCLQRDSKQIDDNFKATKYFKDILPSVILMRVLEAIAASLNIKTCIGISARNQLSLGNEAEYLKFYSIYDEFWILNGGHLEDGNYKLSFPIPQKDILSVQQKHRNRTIKKRVKLDEIYIASYSTAKLRTPALIGE